MKFVKYLRYFLNVSVSSGLAVLLLITSCKKNRESEIADYSDSTLAGYFKATLNDSLSWTFDSVYVQLNQRNNKLQLDGEMYLSSVTMFLINVSFHGLTLDLKKQLLSKTNYKGQWEEKPVADLFAFDEDIFPAKWSLDTTRENYIQFTEINEANGILRGKFQLTAYATTFDERYKLPQYVSLTNGTFELLGGWKYYK